jgi:oligopeptide transport system ATP-binding protein
MTRPNDGAPQPILEVADLDVSFATTAGTLHAVNGVSFTLNHGETLAILGESGSGKSVTAQALLGLVRSPPGTVRARHIRYRGEDLHQASPATWRRMRGQHIAMIFQDPMTSLDPGQTVGRQIGEMFEVHRGMSRRNARRQAIELMERVRIPSAHERVDNYPHQFSGGMSQRVMIAMAISLGPDVLIADEPTTALDVTVQAEIMDLLGELTRESGMALMLITHDLELAAENADRVAVMYAGRLVETGPMDTVYRKPAHPYTLGLLASVPRLEAKGGRLQAIGGTPPQLTRLPTGCAFHPRCRWRKERCVSEQPVLESLGAGRAAACHFLEQVANG